MKNKFIIICLLLFLPACAYAIRYDGPYDGKVIDAETRQPIEGVVVLGVWYKEEPTVAGAVSSYYDANETVTDNNGDFKIKGFGLKILSNIMPMSVLIFKAGYEYVGMGSWDSFKEDELLKKKIQWKGNSAIIPLRKLTMAERKKQDSPDFPSEAPGYKIKLILKEINKDRIEKGLGSVGTER